MRVSVIIPCYNTERFVRTSLLSVAAQTLPPCEIIAIDDGSTDRTADVIKASGVDVRLLRTERRGAAGARNAGLQAAKGDWFAFLDGDDVWYPNHLQRAAAVIREHGATGYINHYDHLSVDGKDIIKRDCPFGAVMNGTGIDDFLQFFADYGSFVGMSACLVDANRALTVGGFDEDQVRRHDLEFWLRVIDGSRWVFDPGATSAYRKHTPGSISADQASSALYRLRAFLKHGERVEDRGRFGALVQELARAALAKSYEFGGAEDQALAYRIALRHLGIRHKAVYGLLRRAPALFKILRKAGLT